MKRNNKKHRRLLKKKEKQARLNRLKEKSQNSIYAPPQMKLFKLPEILPNISQEERKVIIKQMGENAEKTFSEKYNTLYQWFEKYDALYLLSFFSSYFLFSPEGKDREAEGTLEYYEFYLEILQALSLFQKRTFNPQPIAGELDAFLDHIKEAGNAIGYRFFNYPENINTDEEFRRYALRHQIIMNTTAVRNWAYYFQMEKTTLDLAKKNSKYFKEVFCLDFDKAMTIFFQLTELVENRLNIHRGKMRRVFDKKNYTEVIQVYNEAFPENKPIIGCGVEEMWNIAGRNAKNLKSLLLMHSDLKLQDIYTFTIDDMVELYGDCTAKDSLRDFLDRLSFSFGDLADCNKEHMILDNPIHKKPFIKIDEDMYYCSIIGSLPHFAINIMESIISDDDSWKELYSSEIKPSYLQKEAELLFQKYFPNANIFPNSKWKEGRIGYENDLLVVLDNFAIVVELKSGAMTPKAERAHPERLERTFKELLVEPAIQANRFIKYLKENPKEHKLSSANKTVNIVDSRHIKYYIPLSVTISDFGTIGSNLKELIESGFIKEDIIDLTPSISLGALEIIFDLLPFEAQRIHYLARRKEFERHVNYLADEIDLLGFYLDTGFNIGETEFNKKMFLNLGLKSKEIDPYYVYGQDLKKTKKPKPKMTKFWNDIIAYISSKKINRWCELVYILLNAGYQDQKDFEKLYLGLQKRVKIGQVTKKYNWINLYAGPPMKRFLIGGFVYRENDKEVRNSIAIQIFDEEGVEDTLGALCIGCHIKKKQYPYSFIGSIDNNILFNERF